MDIEHYPYRFVKKVIEPWDGPQGFLLHRLLYSFKSPKRFRVYRRFMLTNFGNEEYKHQFNVEKSAYMLINRKYLAAHPGLMEEIVSGFRELYPYFD